MAKAPAKASAGKAGGRTGSKKAGPRPEKVAAVAEVRDRLTASRGVLLTEYRGLDVSAMAALRRSLREAGGEYKVYKNTLVRFAVRDAGLEELESLLEGPTAIAFADGELPDVARALRDFARAHPTLVVKGGLLGDSVITAAEADAMAALPPRDVLLARLAGGMAAPLQKLAGLLQALPRNLAFGLSALVEQRGGADTAAQPAPAGENETGEAAAIEAAEPAPDGTGSEG